LPNARTNFLFITFDQQHWFTLGCMDPEVKTPNLDRLVRVGTTGWLDLPHQAIGERILRRPT